MTQDILGFLEGTPNYGWVIKDDGWFSGVASAYYSRESSSKPTLTIVSTDAPPDTSTVLEFPTPGVLSVDTTNGSEILDIPDHGQTFNTINDAIAWTAEQLNGFIQYDAAGNAVGTYGQFIQYGDVFYIDPETGASVEIDDVPSALLGGKDGVVTIAGTEYCARPEVCGDAFKQAPEVDRECDGAGTFCGKTTSWFTPPAQRLWIYFSTGSKVEQREGGYHRSCHFCWKHHFFPWRCCSSSGSNTLELNNRYVFAHDNGGGYVTTYTSKSNATQIKERMYATFSANIEISFDGKEVVGGGDAVDAFLDGVCGHGIDRSPAVYMDTAAGDVTGVCDDNVILN